MACGVPVIGSRTGEIPVVIGDAGLLFPEGDVDALRQALRGLIESPDSGRALGARGRARAIERYSMRRIAAETVRVYRQMMA